MDSRSSYSRVAFVRSKRARLPNHFLFFHQITERRDQKETEKVTGPGVLKIHTLVTFPGASTTVYRSTFIKVSTRIYWCVLVMSLRPFGFSLDPLPTLVLFGHQ